MVSPAQMLLGELGFDPGEADGVMGKRTRNAILRFQRKNDIRVDGKVSAELITTLQKQQTAREAADRKAKQAEPAESPAR